MDVLMEGLTTGIDFNVSDAFTINGQPGDVHECSQSAQLMHMNSAPWLRSLASEEHPIAVPVEIDTRLVFTMSLYEEQYNTSACSMGDKLAASMNNIFFLKPKMDILSAYYGSIKNAYTAYFPAFPPYMFNFTADTVANDLLVPVYGTRALVVEYITRRWSLCCEEPNCCGGIIIPPICMVRFYAAGQGFGSPAPALQENFSF